MMKNIATFRCYGNISLAKYYVPPLPFKNFLTKEVFLFAQMGMLVR